MSLVTLVRSSRCCWRDITFSSGSFICTVTQAPYSPAARRRAPTLSHSSVSPADMSSPLARSRRKVSELPTDLAVS